VALTSDGSLQYTPNPNFHGADSFTYRASDGQAESDPATVNITVTPIDLAIQLEVSGEAFGADAGVVWAGATFWVNAYVQDRRDAPQGVVGGAVDILFDPLVVLPTGNVVYGEDFSVFQQGHVESASGEIDEAGAISVATNTGATALAPFMAWEFTIVGGLDVPTAVPHVAFAVEPGEGAATITPASFALTGSGNPVAWDCVALGAAEADLYYGDFNGDRLVNHFDLALWQSHADQTVDSLGYDRLYDLDNDGGIGEADLDLLLAAMYRPAAPPSGVTADAEASEASEETSPRPSDEPLETSELLLAIDGLFACDPLWEVG
ncbi:MAG: cadherin-like domain-containing protein, partial [Pirellulaceae bacterium]|nr:cadherin-like domain-containing protein [Pirellulaceae bacterium]